MTLPRAGAVGAIPLKAQGPQGKGMLGILDFFAGIFDLVVYWRMALGLALTALVCWLLFLALPGPSRNGSSAFPWG